MQPLDASDPTEIGRYRLTGRLGSGGMGNVYLGRSPGGRPAAVKVIGDQFRNSTQALERFRREVETLRTVRSAYTAALIDSEVSAPPYWLATEYVPGPTLDMAVAAKGPLPPDLCRALLAALAEGLAGIHTHGVCHRDVKPQNVILSATGPQLIDFGIARGSEQTALTQAGHSMGTPGYTAPEILTRNDVGPGGDVFALGATIAFAATGRPPYGEGLSTAIAYRSVHENIDLDGVDPALGDLISACVTRDPQDRWSPGEVVARCQPQVSLVDHPAYHHALTSSSTTSAVPAPPTVPAAAVPPDRFPETAPLAAVPAEAEIATTALPTGTPGAPPGAAFDGRGAQGFPPSAPGAVPHDARRRRARFILMGTTAVAVLAGVLIATRHSGQGGTRSLGAATTSSRAPVVGTTPADDETVDTPQPKNTPTRTPPDENLDAAPAEAADAQKTGSGSGSEDDSPTNRCTADQLQLSITMGEAGAGHVGYSISLRNNSPGPCVLNGFPGVSLQSAGGLEIGKPADRVGSAGVPLTLSPGSVTEAVVGTLTGNPDGGGCWEAPARMTVYPPGSKQSLVVATSSPTVCGEEFTVTALRSVKR